MLTELTRSRVGAHVRRLVVRLTLLGAVAALPVYSDTTIYVGKHFEVRDHDQPTKYVFNGESRVARITGSLSSNTRVQRLRLGSGWNLRALALTAPNALHQFTNSQPAILDPHSIFQWSSQSLSWLPVPSALSLPAGTILWLHSTTNTTLAVTGTYADPTNQHVAVGESFVPGSGLETMTLPTPGMDLTLWHHDAASQIWHPHASGVPNPDAADPLVLAPGEAIFINAGAPVELEAPEEALRVCYYHQDHLGSSSAITDASGALIEETTFYPFGTPRNEHRLRPIEESYKFTGKERDQESHLHYFEARYLAGDLSRFITGDSRYANADGLSGEDLASFLSNPQEMNLYTYVLNNPLNRTDPTGFQPKKQSSASPRISTPLEGEGRKFVRLKDGSVVVTLKNNVKVTILQDKLNLAEGEGGKTKVHLGHSPKNIQKDTKKMTYSITIGTRYERGSDPSEDSKFGRGTTNEDIKQGNTSLRFHEGQHGARVLDFLENHPLPQLNPEKKNYTADWTWKDAAEKWNVDIGKYEDDLGEFQFRQTDCVGRVDPICK